MPKICVEEIPDNLLVWKMRKNKNDGRPCKQLKENIRKWMLENINSHWFMSYEIKDRNTMIAGYYVNFTCEFDAIAWKLMWL